MKLIKYFVIILVTTVIIGGLSSCKKFLDPDINNSSYYYDSTLFSTVGGTYGALIGTYQNLVGDYAYGIRLSLYYTVDNDEMLGPVSTPYPDNTRRDLAHYALSSSNTELQQPYANLYQGAEQANLCIYYIQRSKLFIDGNPKMRSMLAEAYTLRAQFYFDLVKIWGDVPFFNVPHIPSTNLPVYPTRTDRDTIYEQLLSDLHWVDTSNLIGWRSASNTERVSLEVVKGLRARIALFRAGYSLRHDGKIVQGSNPSKYYQIASDECAAIIANTRSSLNPSFKSVFSNNANHIYESEILFAVGAGESGTNDGNTNTKLGYYDGPRLIDNTVVPNVTYGNGSVTVIPTYFYKFDSTDTRRDVTICIYSPTTAGLDTVVGTPTTKFTDGKFRRDYVNPAPVNNAQYMGIDWPLLRYSDILLMYSEAQNELGNNSEATRTINLVRARAKASLIPAGLSHDDFLNAIVNERSLEFGGEGMRKYDLIRWNKFVPMINATRYALDLFATSKQVSFMGSVIPIPSSIYWKSNPIDGSIVWSGGNAAFYMKSPPVIGTKATWATSSASYTRDAAGKSTVFPYLAADFVSGKSELYPLPIQEVQMNPNLQYVGTQSWYPTGQNPGY